MNYLKRIGLILVLTLSLGGIVFSADDAAILLEEAIYAEETLGDSDQAARIYQQIADNAESGRASAAQALYRLGKYYEGRGRAQEAKAAFTRLAKQYPEQKGLISRIPDLATSAQQNLPQLLPAPWDDGEMLKYSTITNGTAAIAKTSDITGTPGNVLFTNAVTMNVRNFSERLLVVKSESKNGKKAWRFRSIAPSGNLVYSTNVLAMDGTLAPVEASYNSWDAGDNLTKYFSDSVVVGTTSTRTIASQAEYGEEFLIPLPGRTVEEFRLTDAAYDDEQIIYILRCLPLQMGFETTIPIFKNGIIMGRKISVESHERVVTPAGTFDAWKVAYGNKGSETFYWISDDSHRYPVKFSTGTSVHELASISRTGKNEPVAYSDKEISFSLPPGWFLVGENQSAGDENISNQHLNSRNFIDPEYKTSCDFKLTEYISGDVPWDVSKNADENIAMNKIIFGDYRERPGSRQNITISGISGIRNIIDRKSSKEDRDLIVYTFRVAYGNKTFTAYLRTAKEDFDRFRPVFDSIIGSIQLK